MLLLMLGAVILLMRQVTQPASVQFLGQLFAPERRPVDADQTPVAIASARPLATPVAPQSAVEQEAADAEAAAEAALWAPVKDNAIFLAAEQPAWLALLERVQGKSLDDLAKSSVGNVAYAQLVNQPQVYRGKSVRVSGRVLRASAKPTPANKLGIKEYYQLTLAPRGGGEWPIVVYALGLPAGFPRGDDLQVDLAVDGLFFKNWSFPYDGGMGVAPVVVTPTLRWSAPVAAAPPTVEHASRFGDWRVLLGAVLAIKITIGFICWAIWQTRRPRQNNRPLPELVGLESEP